MTGTIPRDITDRISDINDEIKAGFKSPVAQPPEPATLPSPDVQTSEVAKSPDSATSGDIEARQQPTVPAESTSLGRSETQGVVSPERSGAAAGTSNRLNEEVYGEGQVPSGRGADSGELLDNARADLRSGIVDPYSVLSKARANPDTISNADYATLAAEHERLVNDAVAKQRSGDPNADQAAQAANDFANALQPFKTAASDKFRLFQGDVNYDMSTPFGIDQYMKAELGRGMTDAERPMFEKQAAGIRDAENQMGPAVDKSDARVQRAYRGVKDISLDEAVARVKSALGDCQV